MTDAALNTQYVNAHMAALVGRSTAEMQGAGLLSFVPVVEQVRVRECFEGFRTGTEGQTEIPFLRGDGSSLATIVSATPLPAEGERDAGFLCFVLDITSRRQIEDALRRSEAYYRVLTTAAQDHIFVINDDDRVEYVNQAAAEQLQTTPDKVIGKRRSEIFPPAVAERQAANLRAVLTEGKPLYAEGRTMYLDREVWLSTWLAPIPDENGKVTAVLGLSRDMTARKRAEDELRATEQRLRVVLSNLPLVLWASNREGIATFCAGQALQALGIDHQEVVGRPFENIGVEPFTGLGEHVRRALAGESCKQPDRRSGSDVRSLVGPGARRQAEHHGGNRGDRRYHRASQARGRADQRTEDGSHRPVGRRHCPRLQQQPDGHHRVRGHDPRPDRRRQTDLGRSQGSAAGGRALGRPCPPASRVRAPAGDSTARTESQQRHRRVEADARAPHRRVDSGRGRARPRCALRSWEMPVRSSRSS